MKLPRAVKRLFPNVTRVVDSRKPVRARVSERDCRNGKIKDIGDCALAKSMKREYQADGAIIGLNKSYIIKGNKAIRFITPASVAREIVSFDRHKFFSPGTYHLSPVSPSQRLGTKQKSNGSGSRKVHRIVHKRTLGIRVMA